MPNAVRLLASMGEEMTMVRSLVVAAICTALLIGVANAHSSGYRCTVKDAVTADAGVIRRTDFTKSFVGKEFVVDRSNGKMLGDFASGIGWDPKILDYGSSQQSFKVAYTSAPYVHVRLLNVSEFGAGNQKDFFMTDEDNFFSGKCVSLN
jgi:hypothetical protein